MKRPSIKRSSVPADERIPRGAIIVVAIGLLATLAAALLTQTGAAAAKRRIWNSSRRRRSPDSKKVAVPGSKKAEDAAGRRHDQGDRDQRRGLLALSGPLDARRSTRAGGSVANCSARSTRTRTGTLIAQSSGGLRMLYPRSSEEGDLRPEIPETVLAKFASHGHQLALLEEVTEDMPENFTTIQGVKVGWPEYEEGTEHILYYLPHGKAKTTVELPFYTIWKSRKRPRRKSPARSKTKLGKATVETEGSLPRVSPPIDEEAEELKQEEREEEDEAAEEKEGE